MPSLIQTSNKTMMKYILGLLFLLPGISNALLAQDQSAFFKAVDKIERLAKEGTGDGNAKPLIKAIKLLIKHPKVRPLNYEEKRMEEDYFNPYSLLALARKYAKGSDPLLRKLARMEKRLMAVDPKGQYATMGPPSPKNIQIPSAGRVLFKANEQSKNMSFKAREDQHVIMEFQLGKDIGIRVFDSEAPDKALANSVGDEIKRIEFDVTKGNAYLVELYNTNGKIARLLLASFVEPL